MRFKVYGIVNKRHRAQGGPVVKDNFYNRQAQGGKRYLKYPEPYACRLYRTTFTTGLL
jgi:hypothetical protein